MEQENPTGGRSIEDALTRLVRMLRRSAFREPRRTNRYNHLLSLINAHNGVSARELAELMDIRPSSLTEMLNRMEEDGLVRRYRDEDDQRIVSVRIEKRGTEQLEESRSRKADTFADILNADEVVRLVELCEKLSDGLESRALSGEREDHPHHHGHHPHHRDHGRGHGEGKPGHCRGAGKHDEAG